MKTYAKYILAAATFFATFTGMAQEHGRVYYDGYRMRERRLIDWQPNEETPVLPQRYTVAIRPFHLFNRGLKADFEFELPARGQWLQFSLAGYYSSKYSSRNYADNYYSDDPYVYNYNWACILAGFGNFRKFEGAGIGAAYKTFFSNSGWYWSAGLVFTFANVHHDAWGYHPYTEDGMQFYEYDYRTEKTQFYKPGLNFNIGRHISITRNLFLDGYIGLGYEYALIGGFDSQNYYSNPMFSFRHRGVYVSGGVRLGWLWPGKDR